MITYRTDGTNPPSCPTPKGPHHDKGDKGKDDGHDDKGKKDEHHDDGHKGKDGGGKKDHDGKDGEHKPAKPGQCR